MLPQSGKVKHLCECMLLFIDGSKSKVALQAHIYKLYVYLGSTLYF